MPSIPAAATSSLLHNGPLDASAALAMIIRDTYTPELCVGFAHAARLELANYAIRQTIGNGAHVMIGNTLFATYRAFSAARLYDLQAFLKYRVPLATVVIAARFDGGAGGSAVLLDMLADDLDTVLADERNSSGCIVALNPPPVAQAEEDPFEDPLALLDDRDLAYCAIIDPIIERLITLFDEVRALDVATPWPATLRSMVQRAAREIEERPAKTQVQKLRRATALSFTDGLDTLLDRPRQLTQRPADQGIAIVGNHPAYLTPILGVQRHDGTVVSLYPADLFPNVQSGEAISIS